MPTFSTPTAIYFLSASAWIAALAEVWPRPPVYVGMMRRRDSKGEGPPYDQIVISAGYMQDSGGPNPPVHLCEILAGEYPAIFADDAKPRAMREHGRQILDRLIREIESIKGHGPITLDTMIGRPEGERRAWADFDLTLGAGADLAQAQAQAQASAQ